MEEGQNLSIHFPVRTYLHVWLLPLQIAGRGVKLQNLLFLLHLHAQPAATGSHRVRPLDTYVSRFHNLNFRKTLLEPLAQTAYAAGFTAASRSTLIGSRSKP